MAAQGDGFSEAVMKDLIGHGEKRPIATIVFIVAMQGEAQPLVNKFQLVKDDNPPFPKEVSWVLFNGMYKCLNINVVCPGKDSKLVEFVEGQPSLSELMFVDVLDAVPNGVDCVGTIPASLVTYAAIQAIQPDLIISAGTAGGFKAKGASIGDVYIVSSVAFHDRRIPVPVLDLYGVSMREAFPTPNLIKELNLKVGRLSTGDSMDMSPHDQESITANDATVKDMEGAAVVYVADIFKVPTILLKAVTDIVDGGKPTTEEYLQNLAAVTAKLDQSITQVIDFISGKCLSDL